MSFLEIKGLEKGFGKVEALRSLDMSVTKGEIYGFLGPNGAGKTTTLRIIMGLIGAERGTIRLKGKDISFDDRGKIGYLPERLSLYGRMTVDENMNFFCKLKGCKKTEPERIAKEFELYDILDRKVETLSKGVRQKLGLGQALIGDPHLLVLDEPTSGLDPAVRRWVKDKMLDLKSRGKTILFSSHVLGEVQEICDRVGIISNGRMLTEDRIDELTDKLRLEDRLILTIEHVHEALRLVRSIRKANRPRIENGNIVFYCDKKNKVDILKKIIASDHEVLDIIIDEPDLEEIFVKLTEETI